MKRKLLFLVLSFLVLVGFSAENNSYVPVLPLNENTKLTVLNSRLGSRFSFSFASADKAMHLGSLGYDLDEMTEFLIEVQTAKGNYCFRTSGLPDGSQYLLNQTVRVGMTEMELVGITPDGIKVSATIVSPFTISEALKDTTNLKMQIVPGYYLIFKIMNNGTKANSLVLRAGFKKNIVVGNSTYTDKAFGVKTWVYGKQHSFLYFRDNSDYHNTVILATLNAPKTLINKNGFNVFQTNLTVQPKVSVSDTLVLASFYNNQVIYDNKYNLPLNFYYTKFWNSSIEVTGYLKSNATEILNKTNRFENILTRSSIDGKEKWVNAIAFRSDIANSFLLIDKKDTARFYLAEGRFNHLSTVDVAHETELMAIFAPWRLKIQLEQWIDYVSRRVVDRGYTKYGHPHKEGMSAAEYGPFIYHDVGDFPFVSPTTDYSFGPHMAIEENSNFALLLYFYWKLTGDNETVKNHLGMLDVLMQSMINRDTDNDGLADMGQGWATYDMADVIKRSPNNVLLGIKQLNAYLLASEMFEKLSIHGDRMHIDDVEGAQDGAAVGFKDLLSIPNQALRNKQALRYRDEASKISTSLKHAYAKYGYLPCSLDTLFKGWDQHSVVLSEALFYPMLGGFSSSILDSLMPIFKSSYEQALKKSIAPYGIRLASKEEGTWFSKIMLMDIVASYAFNINNSSANYTYAWNVNNYYAYNDGVNEDGKTSWIGFWYPRGISSLGYLLREAKFKAYDRNVFIKDLR